MKTGTNISVGIVEIENEKARVTIAFTNDTFNEFALSTKFAKHIATQLIMAANYIEENQVNDNKTPK